MSDEDILYSAGDCTVCADAGLAAAVVSRQTNQVVYLCPSCGIAWPAPPATGVGEVLDIVELAPEGIRLPMPKEVQLIQRGGVTLQKVEFEEWAADLAEYLDCGHDSQEHRPPSPEDPSSSS